MKFHRPNNVSAWRANTLYTKEPATIGWLMSLPSGSVLWDVGANIGIYSVFAAVQRDCRVVAFEPSPTFYAELMANIELNDVLVTAVNVALGDQTKPNKIDALVASHPFPEAIKIDTDGHDLAVLQGAAETLCDKRLASLIVEVDKRQPETMNDMRAILRNSGLFQVGEHTCPLTPRSPIAVQHWYRG